MIHVDTSFLIDLLRGKNNPRGGAARDLLSSFGDDEIVASVYVACELAAGVELAAAPDLERRRVTALLERVNISYPDQRFPATYGRLLAALRRRGKTIAAMDLLIATAAVLDDAPLISANPRDFERVPELTVRRY